MHNGNMKNRVQSTHINGGNADSEEDRYREILKEHGIKKQRNEILTEEDLRLIFVYMQEDTCVGM
jgi:uncharacterized metal-binding protein